MIDITALLMVIAKHVRKHFGEKSLNELIAMGIAVYLEIINVVPKSRALNLPAADPDVVAAVLDEISEQ